MLGNKMLGTRLQQLSAHINMTSLVILHMEGILMAGYFDLLTWNYRHRKGKGQLQRAELAHVNSYRTLSCISIYCFPKVIQLLQMGTP